MIAHCLPAFGWPAVALLMPAAVLLQRLWLHQLCFDMLQLVHSAQWTNQYHPPLQLQWLQICKHWPNLPPGFVHHHPR